MSVSTNSNITVGGNTSTSKAVPSSDVFTRAGDFQLDKEGYLVNSTGLKLQGYDLNSTDLSKTSIRIAFDNGTPDGKLQNISINSIGIISVNYAGQTTPSELFQIAIATFPKDSSLKAIGNTKNRARLIFITAAFLNVDFAFDYRSSHGWFLVHLEPRLCLTPPISSHS